MAIFSRFLNGAMGPINQNREVDPSVPYVDDVFDPLFTQSVRDYNNGLYGPVVGTLAGYSQMLDNALMGRQGILGPGMGILSTFGRSMDKADDFILGGLTEGVNALGNKVLGGSNDAPESPFRNIFVEDQDYEGTQLMAAMGNAMSRMAGGAKLDESDFTSLGDRAAGGFINLATDPGYLGSRLAGLNGTVGELGSIMSGYDDLMAKISGNMAFPGAQAAAANLSERLSRFLGAGSNRPLADSEFVTKMYSDLGTSGAFSMSPENAHYAGLVLETPDFGMGSSAKRLAKDVTDAPNVATPEDIENYWMRQRDEASAEDMAEYYRSLRPGYMPQEIEDDDLGTRLAETPSVDVEGESLQSVMDEALGRIYTVRQDMLKDATEAFKVLFGEEQMNDTLKTIASYANADLQEAFRMDTGGDDEDNSRFRTYSYVRSQDDRAADIIRKYANWNGESRIPESQWELLKERYSGRPSLKENATDNEKAVYGKAYDKWLREMNRRYNPEYDPKKPNVLKTESEITPLMVKDLEEYARNDPYTPIPLYPTEKELAYVLPYIKPTGKPAGYAARGRYPEWLQIETSLYPLKKATIPDSMTYIHAMLKKDLRPDFGRISSKNDMNSVKGALNELKDVALDVFEPHLKLVTDPSTAKKVAELANGKSNSLLIDGMRITEAEKALLRENLNRILATEDLDRSALRDIFDEYPQLQGQLQELAASMRPTDLGSWYGARYINRKDATSFDDMIDDLDKIYEDGIKYFDSWKADSSSGMTQNEMKLQRFLEDYGEFRARSGLFRVADENTGSYGASFSQAFDSSRIEPSVRNYVDLHNSLARREKDGEPLPRNDTFSFRPRDSVLGKDGSGLPIENADPTKLWNGKPVSEWPDQAKASMEIAKRFRNAGSKGYKLADGDARIGSITGQGTVFGYDQRNPIWDSVSVTSKNYPYSDKNLDSGDKRLIVKNPDGTYTAPIRLKVSFVDESGVRKQKWEFAKLEKGDTLKITNDSYFDYGFDASGLPTRVKSKNTLDLFLGNRDLTKASTESYVPDSRVVNSLPEKLVEGVSVEMATAEPETAAKLATDNVGPMEMAFQENVLKAFDKSLVDDWAYKPMDLGDARKFATSYGRPEVRRALDYVEAKYARATAAKMGSAKRGIQGSKEAAQSISEGDALSRKYMIERSPGEYVHDPKLRKAHDIFRKNESQVVKGIDFINYPRDSGGYVLGLYKPGDAVGRKALDDLTHNVEAVNRSAGGDVFRVINVPVTVGGKRLEMIGYAFAEDASVKANFDRLFGMFTRKAEGLALRDVTFHVPQNVAVPKDLRETYDELDSFYSNLRNRSSAIAKRFGATELDDDYIKHMVSKDESSVLFDVMRKDAGVNAEDLGNIVDAIDQAGVADDVRLTFGAKNYKRAFLGDTSLYGDAFSSDPSAIARGTFAEGTFDNVSLNAVQEMFFNDNGSLSNFFADRKNLADFLRKPGSGNAVDLSVVSPTLDENGKIVGFKTYDPWNDADLDKAMADPYATVLPNSLWGKYKRLLMKERRMSSNAMRFINKYVTVPFKFGVLANPGFLLGNVQDASYKQIETMARRYGTTIQEETFNAARAYRQATQLNNGFSEVYDNYIQFLSKALGDGPDAKEIRDAFPLSVGTLKKYKTLDSAVALNSPKYYEEWMRYIVTKNADGTFAYINPEDRDLATLYTYLNQYQSTATFKNNANDIAQRESGGNLLDAGDVADQMSSNPYNAPDNVVERVMYGDPTQREAHPIASQGLFLNNAYSNYILSKSNTWETYTRLATVLNDLQHNGYDTDRLIAVLKLDPRTEHEAYRQMHIATMSAVNAMNHANFDYDMVSDAMNRVSGFMPFPTFYLKNLAHWVDVFANNPQQIDDVISFHEAMWQGHDTDDEFMAEAKGRGAYPIGMGNKHLTGIVKSSPTSSMFSAFGAVNNARKDATYRTNPLLRPLTRHLNDSEDVKYRPYSTNPYERNVKAGDPGFSDLRYLFHQLNPYERFVNTALRTPSKVREGSWQASDFLPSVFQPDFGKKRR